MNRTEKIAAVCHAANQQWCRENGDYSQPFWASAPLWQHDITVAKVDFVLEHPEAKPDADLGVHDTLFFAIVRALAVD